MKDKNLYDIECYYNYFQVGIENFITGDKISFEISEEYNNLEDIYNFFSTYNGFLISFNGIHYDNMIIKYLLKNYDKYKKWDWLNVTADLKYFSDKIIKSENFDDEILEIKSYKIYWTDVDLFSYWSRMLRISKKISLKSLGIQLGYPVVQELPYKPDTILELEDLPKLRNYNLTHDLGILKLLAIEMEEDIKLRAKINRDYKINCWSMDAPKIASEALLLDYCNATGKHPKDVRNTKYDRSTIYIKDILKDFNPEYKLDIFKDLYKEILNSVDSFSKDLIVNYNNTSIKLTYGVGGLHSVNENEKYYSNDEFIVKTSDVGSLYPNLIINYMCIRFPEVLAQYKRVKDDRFIAKRNKDKQQDTFLKLILNSTSGLLDNKHSWLYYPEGALRLRLIGQLVLTKCIEECLINNWQVISSNTDGLEVIIPKDQEEYYEKVINNVAKFFNLEMDHETYSKIIYKNVNNYISKTISGDVKRKGLFKIPFNEKGLREIPLGDSVNEIVISKALHNYYINNITPEEFISNPDKYNLHIYDYTKSNKISKDYEVIWNNKIQQNLNRYYFSKKSPFLFKKKKSKNTLENVNVGFGVELYNNYQEKSWKDYNINYNYYISKTNKIINEINNNGQLNLFE